MSEGGPGDGSLQPGEDSRGGPGRSDAPDAMSWRIPLVFTCLLFFLALSAGMAISASQPEVGQTVLDFFKNAVSGEFKGDPAILLAGKIFANNLQACILLFIGGATFGALTGFILLSNGLLIGSIIELVREQQGIVFVLAAIVPHGIFEIPSFLLSGMCGFLLARSLLDEWHGRGDAALSARRYGGLFLRYVVPLVAIAAIIEAFITPEIIRLVA